MECLYGQNYAHIKDVGSQAVIFSSLMMAKSKMGADYGILECHAQSPQIPTPSNMC